VRDAAVLTIELPVDDFACDGAAAGQFAGEPGGVDLAIGVCASTHGQVAWLADAAADGTVVLPDDADRIVTGAHDGDLAGAEVAVVGDQLAVGAWHADAAELEDAGAVYLFAPW
jgi:hypothetical protein